MGRYIDADKLKMDSDINNFDMPYGCSFKVIDKQPTADVVEVVRCKDCMFYESNCCFNRQWDFESSTEVPMVRETDFCSYGERRANNDL